MSGEQFHEILPHIPFENIHFLCIGTDRSTGDSLGPLVGTKLQALGFNVTGTIDDPCHAVNLRERASVIPKGRLIIAIDACLGRAENIGKIKVKKGSLKPGAGVGRELGAYGDYSIDAIVNAGGFMEYFVLQNTRLSLVMKMADEIVIGICEVYSPATAQVASAIEN